RGPEAADIYLLPTLWLRNSGSWTREKTKPTIFLDQKKNTIYAQGAELGESQLYFPEGGQPLFTENETNCEKVFNAKNASPYVKDSFHRYVVQGEHAAV